MSSITEFVMVGGAKHGVFHPIGEGSFPEVHRYGLPHYTILIVVITADMKVILNRRTLDAPSFPGRLDVHGGHVTACRSVTGDKSAKQWILQAAEREANEEITILNGRGGTRAIHARDLKRIGMHGEFRVRGRHNKEFSTTFMLFLRYGETIESQDENSRGEVVRREMVTVPVSDLAKMYEKQPSNFADGAARILSRFTNPDDSARLEFLGRIQDYRDAQTKQTHEAVSARLARDASYRNTWEGVAAREIGEGNLSVLHVIYRLRDEAPNIRIEAMRLLASIEEHVLGSERDLVIEALNELTADDSQNDAATSFMCDQDESVIVSDVAKEALRLFAKSS